VDNYFRWNLYLIPVDRMIVTGMISIIANRGDMQLIYDPNNNQNREICHRKEEGKGEVVLMFN
jgi:hypothetical protein